MNAKFSLSFAASLLLLAGCEVPELETPQASAPATQQATTVAEQPAVEEPAAEPQTINPGSPNPNEPPAATSTPREVTALDPARGKKSRATGGYLGAVAGARFYAEHALIFDQVTYALKLYNAEHGEYPKSHEEFMNKIIKYNQLRLPPLDRGVEYIYVPEEHKLMIWRPEVPDEQPSAVEPE